MDKEDDIVSKGQITLTVVVFVVGIAGLWLLSSVPILQLVWGILFAALAAFWSGALEGRHIVEYNLFYGRVFRVLGYFVITPLAFILMMVYLTRFTDLSPWLSLPISALFAAGVYAIHHYMKAWAYFTYVYPSYFEQDEDQA